MGTMSTKQYDHLKERFSILRSIFLPHDFSPTGDYRDEIFEMARAYKVLTHAELEYYFEQIGMAIAKNAYQEWEDKGVVSKSLVALTVYYSGQYASIPDQKTGNNSDIGLKVRVNKAFTEYCRNVNAENNGIKEKNLLKLFLPIGIELDSIPDALIIASNNYGIIRGEIAHTTRTKQNLTPEDALAAADDILNEVKTFDQTIEALISVWPA